MMWLIAIFTLVVFVSWVIVISYQASEVDWGGGAINCIDGIGRILCRHLHHIPEAKIPLPETGAAIVVSNHVSGLDPFLLLAACRRPLRFLVAREQYERPILHWLFKASGCIPVDRSGQPELALRQAMRALEAGEALAIFPHGKIHLDSDPPKKLKGGAVRLSAWTQTAIYPVRIDGVGGEGREALAPFIPSNVQLKIADPISCTENTMKECLDIISNIIENK
ncbi:MAG: lysophospholipid acyltransferase family protein [Gammaproteobacteria bacterium]|nr:lysophospholipid acyltransferase family protein [Gammaproteobacteria bacterium]